MKDVPYVTTLLEIRKATDKVASKDRILNQLKCSLYAAAVQEVLGFPRAHGKFIHEGKEVFHLWNIDAKNNIYVDIGYDVVSHSDVPIHLSPIEDPQYKITDLYRGEPPKDIAFALEDIRKELGR